MKKVLLVGLSVLGLSVFAQEQTPVPADSIPRELGQKIFMYTASKSYNDPVVTRVALYSLISEDPSNISLRDSLAMNYYQQQMFASAALVSQEVANAVPEDMFATEIAALSFDRLGVKSKALKYFDKLYLNNTDDIDKLYKIAFLQLDLKLYEEALTSADQLIAHPESKNLKLIFPTDDSKGQEVSMDIASLRIKALVEEGRENKDAALKFVNEILAKSPDFEIAKAQKEALTK